MIAAPLEAGAVHERVTRVLPKTPVTPAGADGTVAGIMEAVAAEEADVPTEFVAVTANV